MHQGNWMSSVSTSLDFTINYRIFAFLDKIINAIYITFLSVEHISTCRRRCYINCKLSFLSNRILSTPSNTSTSIRKEMNF